jgi:hypothetical protein
MCNTTFQDAESKMWSLISLLDTLGVPTLGVDIPFTLFMIWDFESSEVGKPFEMKIVYSAEDGSKFESKTVQGGLVDSPRVAIRVPGLPTPPKAGKHFVSASLREVGSETWFPSAVAWPLVITAHGPVTAE